MSLYLPKQFDVIEKNNNEAPQETILFNYLQFFWIGLLFTFI